VSLRLTGLPVPNITSHFYDPITQQFNLTWTSGAGKSYTILYTPDLSTPLIPLVTNMASGGNSTTTTISMPAGNSGFLRVQQQ